MPKLNRDSIDDAKELIEAFLPDSQTRQKFINFLCDAISFADAIKSDNWNLNLDPNGRFLRFNTGHEYCIQLNENELLILCDRTTVKRIPDFNDIQIIFIGYNGQRIVENTKIEKVPDLLVKTKNSVGCILEIDQIKHHIDKFRSSNKDFIRSAMNTYLMPQMKRAHSKGAVDYIFSQFREDEEQTLPNLSDIAREEAVQLEKAKALTHKERLEELRKANKKPAQVTVQQTVFIRNQFVVAEVLFRANGHCEQCKKPAPFLRDSDNTPYLEVHHIVRLEDGGDDTVENAIALCPNCHRKAHYGQKNEHTTLGLVQAGAKKRSISSRNTRQLQFQRECVTRNR